MKIIFMGTPDIARDSLKAIYEAGHEILAVVTNPDRQKGRGMKFIFSPVKEFCEEKNLTVLQPEKIKNNTEFIEKLKEYNPELICVVAYGKILPKEILEIPKYGCVNMHASLLPKYRGAAPIQWAVINGDKETGVSTMYMDVGMDTGDIILQDKIEIGEEETTGELWDKVSSSGAKLLVETIRQIEAGTAPRIKQPEDSSVAPMLEKTMAEIDWENKTAEQIRNLIRGLNPIMGAYTNINGRKLKFWKARKIAFEDFEGIMSLEDFEGIRSSENADKPKKADVFEKEDNSEKIDVTKMNDTLSQKEGSSSNVESIDFENIKNGTVLLASPKQGLFIKAKEGILEILEIQGENGKRMSAKDYLRGNKI